MPQHSSASQDERGWFFFVVNGECETYSARVTYNETTRKWESDYVITLWCSNRHPIALERKAPDRTMPIYEVYKNGHSVNARTDIQWMIRDLAEEYDFDERIIFGMIVLESTFNPNSHHKKGNWRGLAQISPYWTSSAATRGGVPRFTDNPGSRNLFDPYDNLITLMEIWTYARNTHNINLDSELGYVKLLYWHSTGKSPTNITRWGYSTTALRFASELREITH
jgi:hypothetical protein